MTRLAPQRVPPPRDEELLRDREVVTAIAQSGYGIFTTMANDRAVCLGFAALGASLLRGTLDAAIREAVILRVAAIVGSEYEWLHHVEAARRAGLTDESIAAVRDDPSSLVDPRLAAAVALASGVEERTVDDQCWSAASAHLTPDQLVQVVMLAGFYGLASRYALAVALEPDERLPTPTT